MKTIIGVYCTAGSLAAAALALGSDTRANDPHSTATESTRHLAEPDAVSREGIRFSASREENADCGVAVGSSLAELNRRATLSALVEGAAGSRSAASSGILERISHLGVPAVSIALINDGKLEWTATYGLKIAGGADLASITTLFQAASISSL
jgi:hypothetical protein